MESQAIIDLFEAQDMVAEEVNQAQARLQSAAVRVVQADRALRTGIITFNGTFEGLKQTSRFGDVLVLISRPQEAVYALQLLKMAFDEYFTTVAEYNRAQFELFHALGYPAREIARAPAPRRGPAGGHGAAAATCPRWATGRPRPPDERRPSGSSGSRRSDDEVLDLGWTGPDASAFEHGMPGSDSRPSDGLGFVMKPRNGRLSILAAGLAPVLGRARPMRCPAPGLGDDARRSRRLRAADGSAINPVTSQVGQPLPPRCRRPCPPTSSGS